MTSSAYISYKDAKDGYVTRYHFSGVISIEHSLTLSIGKTAAEGEDIVNGARNEPDQVTLSVMETDVGNESGSAADLLSSLVKIKRDRTLVKLVTSMGTYKNMLLKEIVAKQDEENQAGWSGTLTFVKYTGDTAGSSISAGTNDNSSTRTNTGNTTAGTISGTVFQQTLVTAGIE